VKKFKGQWVQKKQTDRRTDGRTLPSAVAYLPPANAVGN